MILFIIKRQRKKKTESLKNVPNVSHAVDLVVSLRLNP